MFLIAILVATLQLSSIFTNPAFYSGVKNDFIMRENQFDKKNHEMVLILASLFQEFEFSHTFLKIFQFKYYRTFLKKKKWFLALFWKSIWILPHFYEKIQ